MHTIAMMMVSLLAAEGDSCSLHQLKYDQLAGIVAGQKGRVVIVDFWASYCPPCKKAFPHLVALHNKYRQQGLVVISVSVDDVKDEKAVAAAQAFLRQQKATMFNALLDEVPEVWLKRLKTDGVPVVFVFNRAGQSERKWTEAPDHDELEALIKKLLAEK